MKLFHRTPRPAAILADGFKDARGQYLSDREHVGVWFSDRPLDISEGAKGWTVLVIELPQEAVAKHEWREQSKYYREFCVPAVLANSVAVSIHSDDFAGVPLESIERRIGFMRERDRNEDVERLTAHVEFLRSHGLLAK